MGARARAMRGAGDGADGRGVLGAGACAGVVAMDAGFGDFFDYRDVDGAGHMYEVHRRSLHPAMRACREWGSLLLNDKT